MRIMEVINKLWPHATSVAVEVRRDIEQMLGSSKPRWTRPATDAMSDLSEDQCLWMQEHSRCCYCGGQLFGGPSGGASQNMYCENVDTCNTAFNLSGMIPWGQFLGKVPSHFAEWRKATNDKIE